MNNAEFVTQSEADYYAIILERLRKPTKIISPFFGPISQTGTSRIGRRCGRHSIATPIRSVSCQTASFHLNSRGLLSEFYKHDWQLKSTDAL
jgi:hypothetical protein